MGIEKQVFSVRLEEALVERLKELSLKENRSVSNYVETVLKQHIRSKSGQQ